MKKSENGVAGDRPPHYGEKMKGEGKTDLLGKRLENSVARDRPPHYGENEKLALRRIGLRATAKR